MLRLENPDPLLYVGHFRLCPLLRLHCPTLEFGILALSICTRFLLGLECGFECLIFLERCDITIQNSLFKFGEGGFTSSFIHKRFG